MRVYFEADADPGLIRTRKIAILGYGNQGRPQALNLRDSGVEELRIALRPGSAGAERARADGFDVMTPAADAGWADVVVMLLPDEVQARDYREEMDPNLRPDAAPAVALRPPIRFAPN